MFNGNNSFSFDCGTFSSSGFPYICKLCYILLIKQCDTEITNCRSSPHNTGLPQRWKSLQYQ